MFWWWAARRRARRGACVVLIEERAHLGGDIVYQMLNMWDVPLRPASTSPVVQGIFAEFFDQLGMAFDISKAMRLFEESVAVEPSLHTFTETRVGHVFRQGKRVTGAILGGAGGKEFHLKAKVIVDATNDAAFAARAGAGYFLGRQRTNSDKAMQSAGLLFSVSNVDWQRARRYVRGTRAKKQLGGEVGDYLWERGYVVKTYKPRGQNVVALSVNFGRQSDGTVVLNTLNLYDVNGLSQASVKAATQEATAEIPFLLAHLRKTMPGFEKAQLRDIAPELYIRETRHIQGLYLLTQRDIETHRRFADRIALASYPLDLHPYKRGESNVLAPERYNYTIPLRCLIPTRVDGVFVASRSLSATSAAAGSARVLPITMACGEAAGAAAWLCVKNDLTPQQLASNPQMVATLQNTLRDWGADIGDKYPPMPKSTPTILQQGDVEVKG
jgi:hypothetical protein